MENFPVWELIFSKVTGPDNSKIVFDFSQQQKESGTNYSLRVTSIRSNQARWISLNPKEVLWLLENLYIDAAGRSFRNRWITISRVMSNGLKIVKITQTRNHRTASITFPLHTIDSFSKTLCQAENIVRILNDGIESIPYVQPTEWRDIVAGIVIYHYIMNRKSLLDPEISSHEDICETLIDEMIICPSEILDHIFAFFQYLKFDVSVPFTASDLTRASRNLSGLTRGEYQGLNVHDANDHFPEIFRMMMEVRMGNVRPNWAFPACV